MYSTSLHGQLALLSALVLRLHSYLTAGDTVRVSAFQNCPSIVGRITAVSYSSADTNGEAVHPHLNGRALGREESLFKLQLFIINDDSILPTSREWNCVPSKLNRACKGIKEAAPTNATVWISANYLSGVVFLLHADQCISQEYGSVVGRADTYYVRYYASLTNQTQFDLAIDVSEIRWWVVELASRPLNSLEAFCMWYVI